jgi:hypothetical protein
MKVLRFKKNQGGEILLATLEISLRTLMCVISLVGMSYILLHDNELIINKERCAERGKKIEWA